MRPHHLRLQAFGAFPEAVSLDLDSLGEQGLVLFTGDTGSGKTTLLDALGFALYGTVVGERSKAKDLRSHHAAEGVEPWVELEFTARGRRMRVRRSPAWSRLGRSSDVPAKGQLFECVDGAWVARSTRLDEIGHELSTLLGMSAEQFHSVVVLPQGRFATFLQASSNEREALLKKLFMVERFEFVQEWLATRARAAEESLATASTVADGLAARVAQVEGTDVPEERPLGVWAANLLAAAASSSHVAQATLMSARHAREAASSQLSSVEDLRRRQELRLAGEAHLQSLQADVPAAEARRQAVTVAERARPVLLALVATREARAEMVTASALCRGFDTELAAIGLGAATPLAEVTGADVLVLDALDAAQQRSGRLSALTDVAETVTVALRDAAAATALGKTAAHRVAAAEVRLRALPSQLSTVSTAVKAARAAAADLPELRREVAEEAAAVERLAAYERQVAIVTAQEFKHEATEAAVAGEASVEQELRNRRIDAVASELAAYLEDGTPCPTCGSLDHPEPAEIRADDVTREQERAAGQRLELARSELSRVVAALSAARERRDGLAEQLNPTRLAAAGGDLAARLAELAPLAASLEGLEASERALRQEETDLRVEVVAGRAELAAAEGGASSAAALAAAGQARLSAEVGELSLAEALTTNKRLIDVASRAARALLTLAESRRVVSRAEEAVAVVAQDQGFEATSDAVAGALSEADLQSARRWLADHDAALATATGRLADPDLAVETTPSADVDGARERSEQAHKLESAAVADSALADKRLKELSALTPELSQAVAALAPLRDEARLLRELADVAAGRGANRLRMPLASFVLAARLEEVAEAASVRLELMSGGRYSLIHNDTGRDGRVRAGLALQVEDGWTGRRRDTATLSGGETFMAALALALGLADVVTAETGGASIDALFVDEGFGSLDPDTLDKVMDVLDSLRSGGRLVGVVSHVAEMRQRIPAQVHVVKGINGSTLATTV